jgi:hypothetical protein
MFDRPWLEKTASDPSLLLLYSVRQARFFLKHRTALLLLETQELDPTRAEEYRRCRRLLDRSATFWLVSQELHRRHRKHGLGLLGPKPSLPLPRAFNLTRRHTFDFNTPWQPDEPLLRRIAFCSDSLLAFGGLVVPMPLEQQPIESAFGPKAWEQILRQASLEKARNLAQRWPTVNLKGQAVRL